MNQNPLEKPKVKKTELEKTRDEVRASFGRTFDNKKNLPEMINLIVEQLEAFEKAGFIFDKDAIVQGLREGATIKEKDQFVNHMLSVFEPLILAKIANMKAFDKATREASRKNPDNLPLSEVLFISTKDLDNGEDKIFFHLAPARDLITKENIKTFNEEVEKGLKRLAEILERYPEKKEILGVSWVLARPKGKQRIEDFGFTYVGLISEEEQAEHCPDEDRPVAKAFIKREDFMAKFGRTEIKY